MLLCYTLYTHNFSYSCVLCVLHKLWLLCVSCPTLLLFISCCVHVFISFSKIQFSFMFEVALLRGIYYYCCKSDREKKYIFMWWRWLHYSLLRRCYYQKTYSMLDLSSMENLSLLFKVCASDFNLFSECVKTN